MFDKCTDVIDLTSNHDDDLKRALRLSLQDHKGQSSGISYEDQQLSRLVQLYILVHVLLRTYVCVCANPLLQCKMCVMHYYGEAMDAYAYVRMYMYCVQ